MQTAPIDMGTAQSEEFFLRISYTPTGYMHESHAEFIGSEFLPLFRHTQTPKQIEYIVDVTTV